MDYEKKLKEANDIIEIGNKFYEMLMNFHKDINAEEMQELMKNDPRFIDMEKRMNDLGNKLGM